MKEAVSLIDQGYIQYGFAGFCFVLLFVIIWMLIRFMRLSDQLITLIKSSNSIQAKQIEKLNNVERLENETNTKIDKLDEKLQAINTRMVSRPCLREI